MKIRGLLISTAFVSLCLSLALRPQTASMQFVAKGSTNWWPLVDLVRMGRSLPFIEKAPPGLKTPPPMPGRTFYGEIDLGGPGLERRVLLALVAPGTDEQALFVDPSAGGDFSGAAKLPGSTQSRQEKKGTNTFLLRLSEVWADLPVPLPESPRPQQFAFQCFTLCLGTNLVRLQVSVRPAYAWGGTLALPGRAVAALLCEKNATGSFRADGKNAGGVSLMLDLNGNGRFEPYGEVFDAREPFSVDGNTWKLEGLGAGGTFTVARGDKPVAAKTITDLSKGSPALPFEANGLDGKALRFPEAFRGKLVLLDFWATWCPDCVKELPNVRQALSRFGGSGFAVLGVDLDKDESVLREYARKQGLDWPQVFDGKDRKVAALYRVSGIPVFYLVDGDSGLIVARGDELRFGKLEKVLEKALQGRAVK